MPSGQRQRLKFAAHEPSMAVRGLARKFMIDKDKIIDTVCERLTKLPKGHYLDLRTYKRNRSVMIVKIDQNHILVIENGYFRERFEIKTAKLKKLLKTLLKKEFPRSRKIRLYVMGPYAEDEAKSLKRKII